nr:hypothetical protein CFP56_34790 [Quercus suber]
MVESVVDGVADMDWLELAIVTEVEARLSVCSPSLVEVKATVKYLLAPDRGDPIRAYLSHGGSNIHLLFTCLE